ncbi:S24 family peptidase [Epilithonimonas hispanica]|uniref:Transcriptional regulator n=1 Tax=Epilithonimonas hispanica TaxID=358687 RepID=A0A3D9CZZ9_9FLAO|nr:S24/S26 family peptidase [Epilithonimonas hispanica]REC71342.1 transcriptional regulator [Epilithonimonas hispanica]
MQTNLNKNSNFFERTLEIALFYGFSGIPELAKALGYSSPEKLYRLKKENAKPSVDILQDLSNKFEDLDLNWYITGQGSLQKNAKVITPVSGSFSMNTTIAETKKDYSNVTPTIITVDSHNVDNIVLVPHKLKAGYLEGYNNENFIKKLPSFRMPGLNNGLFRMFEIEGTSMFPTLAGGYVVGQFVENWITGIKDNRIYAVISNEIEDGLIKRCINKIKKYNNLICKSDNRKNYPTQNINPESIKEVWEIKLHLNFQLPDPADIYDKLADLEGEVSSLREIVTKANLLPHQK